MSDAVSRFRDASNEKLRGGYYTPEYLAEAMAAWAIRSRHDRVLEPSSGNGVFVEYAAKTLINNGLKRNQLIKQITGIEIAETEVKQTVLRVLKTISTDLTEAIKHKDYFHWYVKNSFEKFDCVVGNPPFIRYQNFPEPSRSIAMSMLEVLGMKANRLTNIWVPFIACAVSQLKEGGRLAMILPAELLQVSYAAQLRDFLIRNFSVINILTCNQMLFSGAEQEVVLLLAEEKKSHLDNGQCKIDLVEEKDAQSLLRRIRGLLQSKAKRRQKTVDHGREKWLKYFLTQSEISLMRELRNHDRITTLSSHAEVDVGVVTGKNEFFVLSKEQVLQRKLAKFVVPLVARSSHLQGASVDKHEWRKLSDDGQKVHLLYIEKHAQNALPSDIRDYIDSGENLGIHLTYKCSIRKPWYWVPAVWSPDGFLFRQIYDFPRFVVNTAKATSTDTIHRVKCKSEPDAIARNAYTHLTAASAEIEGRSYGGGVLELEPTEAERLLFPANLNKGLPLDEVDTAVRKGQIEKVLAANDKRILINSLGLTKKECLMLKLIWIKMRDRRMSRKKKAQEI